MNRFKVIERRGYSLKEIPRLSEKEAIDYYNTFNSDEIDENRRFKERNNSPVAKALYYAYYVVERCAANNKPISNLTLQKVLYMIQKEYIREFHKGLFKDNIEAWKFGPCIPEVYYHYCCHGAMPIVVYDEKNKIPSCIKNDKYIQDLMNSIIDNVCEIKPWEIKPFKGWEFVLNHYDCGHVISVEIIENEIKNNL